MPESNNLQQNAAPSAAAKAATSAHAASSANGKPVPPKPSPVIKTTDDLRVLYFRKHRNATRSPQSWNNVIMRATLKTVPSIFNLNSMRNHGLSSLSEDYVDWMVAKTLCKWRSKFGARVFYQTPVILGDAPPLEAGEDRKPATQSPLLAGILAHYFADTLREKQVHLPPRSAEYNTRSETLLKELDEHIGLAIDQAKALGSHLKSHGDSLISMQTVSDDVAGMLSGVKKDFFEFLDIMLLLRGEKRASQYVPHVDEHHAVKQEGSAASENSAPAARSTPEAEKSDSASLRILSDMRKMEIDTLGRSKAELEVENAMLREGLTAAARAMQKIVPRSMGGAVSSLSKGDTSPKAGEDPNQESLALKELTMILDDITASTSPVPDSRGATKDCQAIGTSTLVPPSGKQGHENVDTLENQDDLTTPPETDSAEDAETVIILTYGVAENGTGTSGQAGQKMSHALETTKTDHEMRKEYPASVVNGHSDKTEDDGTGTSYNPTPDTDFGKDAAELALNRL